MSSQMLDFFMEDPSRPPPRGGFQKGPRPMQEVVVMAVRAAVMEDPSKPPRKGRLN